jgi:hypothetical protein
MSERPLPADKMCVNCKHPPHLHDGINASCRVVYALGPGAHEFLMTHAQNFSMSLTQRTALVVCGCHNYVAEG